MKTTIALVLVLLTSNACAPYVRYRLSKGEQGETGSQGNTGAKGADGQGCTVEPLQGGSQVTCGASSVFIANGTNGQDGASGINGTDGVNGQNGTNGTNGTNGADGVNGTNGTNGTNGVDATPVTVVTLCPGVSSYPGVFVEVALCLGGNLYGVYSANGGFLTYFPQGNYSSNGIGSACNLTVGPNCTVTH